MSPNTGSLAVTGVPAKVPRRGDARLDRPGDVAIEVRGRDDGDLCGGDGGAGEEAAADQEPRPERERGRGAGAPRWETDIGHPPTLRPGSCSR